ncbi:16S rRNA (uracil(1498)-N(3))-methyltransferase [Candidatus Saccharibacteria bacterium]|nr:16S rRNA (uracil(1498)-N(3))-methyltransferase [Candidatus Saccharibacteria bacterium]
MRLHRFYVSPDTAELSHELWLRDDSLRNQWFKVLRYRVGDEIILFDGVEHDRLYKINRIEPDAVQLQLVTDFERKLPAKHIYLFFSLLKKDKNDWVLQKCTELGVRNFVPIIAERSEKTGFNIERAEKIVIEAAEQCGRSDIPHIREPLTITEALGEYKDKVDLLICDEAISVTNSPLPTTNNPTGILIGPEGGWTENELNLFKQYSLNHLHLGQLTLRAETAAVVASNKLLT